jgi:HD-GYP domain-containing protein (c-di-GMP phosphodiesterase class II)
LRRAAGSQFDAEIVNALIAALADGDDGLPSPV